MSKHSPESKQVERIAKMCLSCPVNYFAFSTERERDRVESTADGSYVLCDFHIINVGACFVLGICECVFFAFTYHV